MQPLTSTAQSFEARAEMEVTPFRILPVKKTVTAGVSVKIITGRKNMATTRATAVPAQRQRLEPHQQHTRYSEPRREDVLNELYRKLYPQVKNKGFIYAKLDW